MENDFFMALGTRKNEQRRSTGRWGNGRLGSFCLELLLAVLTWESMSFPLAPNIDEFLPFRKSRESMVKYVVDLEVLCREVVGFADQQ